MKILYTEALSVTATTPILIQRGAASGSGVISNKYRISTIILDLADSSKQMCIMGVDLPGGSNWVTLQAGEGWKLDDVDASTDNQFVFIKSASGTITVNLVVHGS